MAPQTVNLSPVADRKIVDLCASVDRKIKHPWKFLQFRFGWLLVVFYDSGVSDHPLREQGGQEDGKCELQWYERKNEVVGRGSTPQEAAASILADGKGERLTAMRVASVESGQMVLVFKHLDTGQFIWPSAQLFAGVPIQRLC
jgi:hypothetical protein